MNDVYSSMTRLMDSPWFFVLVGFFVVLGLAPLAATRLVAGREARREDPVEVDRNGDQGGGDSATGDEHVSD